MIVEETVEKLLQLHLKVMAQALREIIELPGAAAMSFEDKLALIVDREWTDRQNRRLASRIKQAKLGMTACMEDVFCTPARRIDKSTIRTLSGCGWVRGKQNVIVIGATETETLCTSSPTC